MPFLAIISLLVVFFATGIPVKAETKAPIAVVIQQIRGGETCCEPGTGEMIAAIMRDEELSGLPLSWALRHDALVDEDIRREVEAMPETQSLGLLLEVTPNFASVSGVTYSGDNDGSDWHYGSNSMLIGYNIEERRKLIDTIFNQFQDFFGQYPSFTVSWMIDRWSLNYIRQNWGVKVHELTKEQFETDSYTLYGGIFNLPYIPSLHHPLLPKNTLAPGLDMVILRQTVSDIEKNYGAYESFYTSQPNDYLSHPQTQGFAYFLSLISTVKQQSESNRWLVLGLENSQTWSEYRDEYIRQLKFLQKEVESRQIELVSPEEAYRRYSELAQTDTPRYFYSHTFPQSGVMWYFGDLYRARVEVWDGQLVLTDFRNYTAQTDPYFNESAHASRSYWIVPYLLDSSQQFIESAPNTRFAGHPVRSDPAVKRFGIKLVANTDSRLESSPSGTITVGNAQNELRFHPQRIVVAGAEPVFGEPIGLSASELLQINTDQYFSFLRHPRYVLAPDKSGSRIQIGWENVDFEPVFMGSLARNEDKIWEIKPNTELKQSEVDSLAGIFQPDRTSYPFYPPTSTFFWHNTEAIAGRNPLRLYVDPRNLLSRTVTLNNFRAIYKGSGQVTTRTPTTKDKLEPFLVDITADSKAQGTIKLTVDGNILEPETPVRFFSNCYENFALCLSDRAELFGFMRLWLREKRDSLTATTKERIQTYEQRIRDWIQKNIPDSID